jgi:ribosome assembly protein YihI (activator of Der GTPase)
MNLKKKKKKKKKGEAVGSRVIVNKHPTSTPSTG